MGGGGDCFLEMCWWDCYRKHLSLFLAIKNRKCKLLRGRFSKNHGTSSRDPDTNLSRVKAKSGRSLQSDNIRFICKSRGRALQRKLGYHWKREEKASFVKFRFPPKESVGSRESGDQFWIGCCFWGGIRKRGLTGDWMLSWGEGPFSKWVV